MPDPVSATARATNSPANAIGRPGGFSPATRVTFSAVSVTVPPPGMASRAFSARFTSASSSSPGSTFTSQQSAATAVASLTDDPIELLSMTSKPAMCSGRFSTTGLTDWRRAKVSSCPVSAAPRCAASSMAAIDVDAAGSPASLRFKSSAWPITIIKRLLKSCATPPVSWPSASIFWAWARCAWASCRASWASRRSVMSRVILAKPTRRPVSSFTRSITTWAQNRLPSLRTRQPSSSKRPSVIAVCRARSGTPAARSCSV